MKKIMLLIFSSFLSFNALAQTICEADSTYGKVKVTRKGSSIIVEGAALEKPVVFNDITDIWDGHKSGLITTTGFAMKYEDHYGILRNIVIITNLRTNATVGDISIISTARCSGTGNF